MPFPHCTAKFPARCGPGFIPARSEDAVPIGHITNGVHVPTWLAPQMFRLYDRHLGTGWHEHSSEARIWEGIENVDDGELWETHLSLKSRLLEFVRRRAVKQAEHRDESPETLQRLGGRPQPGCADDRICAPLRNLQARRSDPEGYGAAGLDGERSEAARCNSFSPANRIRETIPASACCRKSRR